MERVHGFHDLLLWMIAAIVVFVFALLAYACWRFGEKRNPVPSRRSHNTLLEIVWTAVPVLILVIIAIPSFKLLYYMDVAPETELTIKATGHQWYWSYDVPGQRQLHLRRLHDRRRRPAAGPAAPARDRQPDRGAGRRPTSASRPRPTDVLHSWAVPQFGVKVDAVPGRLNQLWINVDEPGIYYGQCSELCGVNHGFMPITVEAVTKAGLRRLGRGGADQVRPRRRR